MMEILNPSPDYQSPIVTTASNTAIVNSPIVWYVVAIVVLVAIGVTLAAAMVVFCISKGKSFYGDFKPAFNGYLYIGCR